jgi:hypothetical protein
MPCLSRYITNPWIKVFEAVLVAGCSAVVFMLLIYGVPDCQPISGFNANGSSSLPLTVAPSTVASSDRINGNDVIPDGRGDDVPLGFGDAAANQSDVGSEQYNGGDHSHVYGLHGNHGYVFQVSMLLI